MDQWQSLVDKQLQDILKDGDTSHLPGAGKPLNLEEDSNTPPDMRMANKIMKDHNVLPSWMILGQEVDNILESLRQTLYQSARQYRGQLGDARRRQDIAMQEQVEAVWQKALREIRVTGKKYMSRVLDYNLQVPPGIPHKSLLNIEQEVQQALNK